MGPVPGLLFARTPSLEVLFRILAITALGWLALDGLWILGGVAFFMLLGLRQQAVRDIYERVGRPLATWWLTLLLLLAWALAFVVGIVALAVLALA